MVTSGLWFARNRTKERVLRVPDRDTNGLCAQLGLLASPKRLRFSISDFTSSHCSCVPSSSFCHYVSSCSQVCVYRQHQFYPPLSHLSPPFRLFLPHSARCDRLLTESAPRFLRQQLQHPPTLTLTSSPSLFSCLIRHDLIGSLQSLLHVYEDSTTSNTEDVNFNIRLLPPTSPPLFLPHSARSHLLLVKPVPRLWR